MVEGRAVDGVAVGRWALDVFAGTAPGHPLKRHRVWAVLLGEQIEALAGQTLCGQLWYPNVHDKDTAQRALEKRAKTCEACRALARSGDDIRGRAASCGEWILVHHESAVSA